MNPFKPPTENWRDETKLRKFHFLSALGKETLACGRSAGLTQTLVLVPINQRDPERVCGIGAPIFTNTLGVGQLELGDPLDLLQQDQHTIQSGGLNVTILWNNR